MGPSRAAEVYERVRRLRAAAADSCEDPARVVAALTQVASRLGDASDALGRELRSSLREHSGLSPEMIDWGLSTTLATLQARRLSALALNRDDAALALIGVVLAGNVFVASLRALSLPLLAGGHVLVKVASGDHAFADAFKRALDDADPWVGRRLELTHFAREDRDASRAFCAELDALSVYGDDDTVQRLADQLRPGATLIAHGNGISAAYVHADALCDVRSARALAERMALDVAAYDQRGCLSPHFVLVDERAAVPPQRFARLLADEALPAIARVLPPGTRAGEARDYAASMQWRAVAAVRGELYDHGSHAVSFEGGHPPRPSPGGRLVSVHSCRDLSALRPFAAQLKCLGVASDAPAYAAAVSGGYPCRIGDMQTPTFDVHADGRPPLAGLRRR